jgi:energy-coupling factor transporter ATP-binding protein EcfA2
VTSTAGSDGPGVPKTHASAELLGAMGDLLAAVRGASLEYDTSTTSEAVDTRGEVADQLSDYILPRLVQLDAPLLTVVGGSTGAGKSTLVNSIVGAAVTEAGILRPTTRSPVLVHHPEDEQWFGRDRLLPDLERVEEGSAFGLRLVSTEQVPQGLAVLDAPDVDSIDQGNRDLATQLLAAADLWLFVTSAARYADQVPWDYLRRASERATSVAVVLDRTPDESIIEVRGHLARMMTSRGLSDSPLFTVPEVELDADGLVTQRIVAPIRGWLHDLAADVDARRLVVGRTLDGAVRHIVLRSHDVADAMDDQLEVAEALQAGVDAGYGASLDRVTDQAADATMMTGEVLTSWQEFVATGDLVKSLDTSTPSLRDRFRARATGKGGKGAAVVSAVEDAVTSLLVDRADAAAETVATHWSEIASGRPRLDQVTGGDRASAELRKNAAEVVASWRAAVTERAREAAPDDTTVTIDDAVTAAVLTEMLVLTCDDLERQSAVGRGVLNVVYGVEQARSLVEAAHADLVARATELFAREKRRYVELFIGPDAVRESQAALREAARGAESARHVDFLNGQITT